MQHNTYNNELEKYNGIINTSKYKSKAYYTIQCSQLFINQIWVMRFSNVFSKIWLRPN